MQVFLPYSDFVQTAQVLDSKRLGNQMYRECLTLIRGSWVNHPVSKMWSNHKYALCEYAKILAEEMEARNKIKPTWQPHIPPKWIKFYKEEQKKHKNTGLPKFVGNKKFHDSHRSNLLRKDPIWYGQFGWKVRHDLPYVWFINNKEQLIKN